MTPEQLVGFLVLNFPGIAIFVYAQHRGWIVLGATYKAQLVLLEELWRMAIADKKAAEERLDRQSQALKELSDVVRQSLDFNERLVADRYTERKPR